MGIYPRRPMYGLSLCAGYGGLDLGLQLAEPGFHTRCFVEIDRDAQAALAAGMVGGHLPGLTQHGAGSARPGSTAAGDRRARPFRPAPVWDNLRTFVGYGWRSHIDAVLAGYPCQPFSAAGQRRGEDDERHLWPDVARIVHEVQPEWLFLENVAGHVSLGLETVLRDIWHMGYTPAAGLFSAAETGAPHERLRVFIVAHTRQPGPQGREQRGPSDERDWAQAHGSTAQRGRPWLHPPGPAEADRWADILGAAPYLAPAASLRDCLAWAGDMAAALEGPGSAATESALCGMADGLAGRSRALRGLGNGVHPLAAGYAWRTLAAAHGLCPVDLDATEGPATEGIADAVDLMGPAA